MNTINEGSECTIETIPLDANRVRMVPTSMRYRIDCLTTRQQVLDWTSIATPAESNLIVVSAALNAIRSDRNVRERKQMTVETTSGTSKRNDTFSWDVLNIQGVK
jgi:hypothetical protein